MDLTMAAVNGHGHRRVYQLSDLGRLEDGPTLGTGDAARMLGLGPFMVRLLIEHDELHAGRIGKCYKIPWRSLRAYCFRVKLLPLREARRP